jgi:TM2 domain-containing membrane protein YozV
VTIPDFPGSTPTLKEDSINLASKSFLSVWLLSLFLGTLGVDRFYLGKTKTGLVKLFSFGGLGLWWIADIFIIATGNMKDNQGVNITPTNQEKKVALIASPIAILIFISILGGSSSEETSKAPTPSPSSTLLETYTMPNLVGLFGDEAVSNLKTYGVSLDDISFVSDGTGGTIDVSGYIVCGHTPASGAMTNSPAVEIQVALDCEALQSPDATATSTEKAPKPTKSEAEETIEVADARGLDYQTAQDIWRAQGLVVLPATDATGQGRWAFIDSGWVVVDQDLRPGSRVPVGSGITASIKKFGE